MRIRNADFRDRNLEQVGNTLNASCRAFYFPTVLDRYYKGMRLRIICPFDSMAHANLEELGEVVRVDEKPLAYGVAVTRLTPNNLSIFGAHSERRSEERFSFVATIEVIDVGIGITRRARTTDLSMSGCYVDTLNPSPPGTTLSVRIHKADTSLETSASVCTQHQGLGMGVVFRDLSSGKCSILRNWLCDAGISKFTLKTSACEQKTETSEQTTQLHLARLVDILNQKGVLSQSEVARVSDTRIID
jgi:hypothetical protein